MNIQKAKCIELQIRKNKFIGEWETLWQKFRSCGNNLLCGLWVIEAVLGATDSWILNIILNFVWH